MMLVVIGRLCREDTTDLFGLKWRLASWLPCTSSPLQTVLMVCHFRYNVDYQTYLVLLTKYLLHHARSFSVFSVTFASGNENHFSFPE